MANLFVNLPAPAGNGAGAGTDVSAMGQVRTITVQDIFEGVVNIQFSNEGAGGPWATALTFANPGKKTINIAARFMRVERAGVPAANPGLPNVDVAADDIGALFLDLPATAGNGTGASIDVSALGTFNTITCLGTFGGTTVIEISEDGNNWATCATFNRPGWISKEFTAQFMRVTRKNVPAVGAGLPNIDVGAINDATAGGGGGGGIESTYALVYQPGGGGSGPIVFADWATLVAEIVAIRAASGGNGDRPILLQFDDSFVTPAVIPAGGPYDMIDVVWMGRNDDFLTAVDIADGASFTGLRVFRDNLQVTNRNLVTAADASLADGDIISLHTQATINTIAGGAPFFSGAALGGGTLVQVIMDGYAAVNFSGTGPVFSFPVSGTFLLISVSSGSQLPSSGLVGGVGAIYFPIVDNMRAVPSTFFSGWGGTALAPRFDGPDSFLPNPLFSAPSPGAVASPAFGDWLRIGVAGGPIVQTLPDITGTYPLPGVPVVVSDIGGSGVLSVAPFAGDTIDGSAAAVAVPPSGSITLLPDGISDWSTINIQDPLHQRLRVVGPFIFPAGGSAAANDIVQVDVTGGVVPVLLPPVAGSNRGIPIIVKKIAGGAADFTLTPAGADTIDGVGGVSTFPGALVSVTLVSDGVSNWMVV